MYIASEVLDSLRDLARRLTGGRTVRLDLEIDPDERTVCRIFPDPPYESLKDTHPVVVSYL